MKFSSLIFGLAMLTTIAGAQTSAPGSKDPKKPVDNAAAQKAARDKQLQMIKQINQRDAAVSKGEQEGVPTRLKDIARFRGIRSNTLTGIGLVMGLEGTGDSKKYGPTFTAMANYLRKQGFDVDPKTMDSKNAALVMITAELPAFSVNGQKLDVTITSMGDAKSLRNGTLLLAELKAAGNPDVVYATATGPISVGGYSAGQGGNSQTKGFVTVGRIPNGGVVEQGAPTTTVYDGKMYLELDDPDITTAHRVEEKIKEFMPEFMPIAQNGATIQVVLPPGLTPTTAMAKLEEVIVRSDNVATIVINEKTGTIVMGGNVRIAPVALATGSLNVKIEETYMVSQPNPLSQGQTVVIPDTTVKAGEDEAQIAVVKPNTTVSDLARIFQELKLKPSDIINILQILKQQGALKAKLVIQ